MIADMTTPTKLIGSAEACDLLHVSRPTLTRMVQSGKIKVAVEGTGVRGPRFFYRSEVERVAAKLAESAA